MHMTIRLLALTACLAWTTAGCRNHKNPATPGDPQAPAPPGATDDHAKQADDAEAPPIAPRRPGAIAFEPAMSNLPTAGMWKCDPALADVNQDGRLDLAAIPRLTVPQLGNGPRFWFSEPGGAWTRSSEGLDTGEISCGGGLEFGDVNNDGLLDLAVADHCQGIFVYLGDGQGGWQMVTRGLYPESIVSDPEYARMYVGVEDLDLGDLNGDGFLDLVAGASDRGGIYVYLGDGTGENWRRVAGELPETAWATRIEIVDIDDDGDADIVASYADGPRVWHNDGAAHFTPASEGLPSPILRGIFIGLAVADFNLDGRQDIAVANWIDGPAVYLQQDDHSWTQAPDVFPDMLGGAVGLDMGDLNNDQRPDLVVAGRLTTDGGLTRGVFALIGDGAGSFAYVPDSGLPETGLGGPGGVTIGDIDNDGWPDVVHGNGLLVETGGPFREPVIDQRLLVWRNLGPGQE